MHFPLITALLSVFAFDQFALAFCCHSPNPDCVGEQRNILLIASSFHFNQSHTSFSLNLARVLAEDGHQVHLFVPILDDSGRLDGAQPERTNLRVSHFMASNQLRGEGAKLKALGPPKEFREMPRVVAKMLLELASDERMMADLRAQHFQIGVAEAFMSNEWALAVFAMLGIPRTVLTTAMPPTPNMHYFFGILPYIRRANIPYIYDSKFGDHLEQNRAARRDEIWQDNVHFVQKYVQQSVENDVAFADVAYRVHGIRSLPLLAELYRRVQVYLANTQPDIDFAAAAEAVQSVPQNRLRFVGGAMAMQVRERQMHNELQLDPQIVRLLAEKSGLVLFSLGTVKQTTDAMSNAQFEAVKGAMGAFLEHLFVWKFTRGDQRFEGAHVSNVYFTHWMDQPAILAHQMTRAFISHCGLNSVLEATWMGVPLICIPLFADQFYNAEALASRRMAVVLDFDSATLGHELTRALGQILSDEAQIDGLNNISLAEVRKLAQTLQRKNPRADILGAVIGH